MRLQIMPKRLIDQFKKDVTYSNWERITKSLNLELIKKDFFNLLGKNFTLESISSQDKELLYRYVNFYINGILTKYPSDGYLKRVYNFGRYLFLNGFYDNYIFEIYKILIKSIEKSIDKAYLDVMQKKLNIDFLVFIRPYLRFSITEEKKIVKVNDLSSIFMLEEGYKTHINFKNNILKAFFEGENIHIPSAEECEFSNWLNEISKTLNLDDEFLKELINLHNLFHSTAEKLPNSNQNSFLKLSLIKELESISLKLIYFINKIYSENLSEIVVYDKLTKVLSRTFMDIILSKEFARSKRYMHPLSILMVDIDNFKNINDTYGHLKGDRVLETVANLIKSSLRRSDYVFRFGGEEFLILLTNTKIDGALKVGEKIRKNIEDFDFGLDEKVTISCGVKEVKNYENPYLEIEEADKRLYIAKKRGKNKCVGDSIFTS